MLLGSGMAGFHGGVVLLGNGMAGFHGGAVLLGNLIASGQTHWNGGCEVVLGCGWWRCVHQTTSASFL